MPAEPSTPLAAIVKAAADIPALQAEVAAQLGNIRQCLSTVPLDVPPDAVQQLQQQLLDVAADSDSLAALVAEQQRLTGLDPFSQEAAAALSPDLPEEVDPATGQVVVESFTEVADPDAHRSLSDASRRQLLAVFSIADTLDCTQVAGLAHLAHCSPHQVRSLFRDLRNTLRSMSTTAIKAAGKAAARGAAAGSPEPPGWPSGSQQQQPQQQQQQQLLQPGLSWQDHHLDLQQQQHQQQPLLVDHPGQQWGSSSAGCGLVSSSTGGPGAGSAVPAAATASAVTCRKLAAILAAERERLARTVDPDSGAITSRATAGQFLTVCESLATWGARSRALTTLAASFRATGSGGGSGGGGSGGGGSGGGGGGASRARLGGAAAAGSSAAVRGQLSSSKLVRILAGWLEQGRQEQQTTFLVQALQVLQVLDISMGLISGSSIQQEVDELTHHKSPAVAAAAEALAVAWAPYGGVATGAGSSGQLFDNMFELGGKRAVGAGYKRRLKNAVKRKVHELALTGELAALQQQQQQQQQHLGSEPAAAAAVLPSSAVQAAGAAGAGAGAAGAAGAGSSGAAGAAGGFKRPSKRVASSAGGATAAACSAQQLQSEAARRLQMLHGLHKSSKPPAAAAAAAQGAARPGPGLPGQQQQQQQQLSAADQLFVMAPHGRAPAAFLAAAGGQAAEVSQAILAYDRAVQQWLTARPAAAAKQRQWAAAAVEAVRQQRDAELLAAGGTGSVGGSSSSSWPGPPLPVPPSALATYSAGQESQLAAVNRFLPAAVGLTAEPDESEALAAAAAVSASGLVSARVMPLHPTDPQEARMQIAKMWIAGVRLPNHILRPPTAAEIARVRQPETFQQQVQQVQQVQSIPPAMPLPYDQQQQQQQYLPQHYQQHYQQPQQQQQQQQPQVSMMVAGQALASQQLLDQQYAPVPVPHVLDHLDPLQQYHQPPPAHHLQQQPPHMLMHHQHHHQQQQQPYHLQQQYQQPLLPHLGPVAAAAPPGPQLHHHHHHMQAVVLPGGYTQQGALPVPVQQQQQPPVYLMPPAQQHPQQQPVMYMVGSQAAQQPHHAVLQQQQQQHLMMTQPPPHDQPYMPQGF